MMTFIIPAFFAVKAETKAAAEKLADDMQREANLTAGVDSMLYQDEELATAEISVKDGQENPHSMRGIIAGVN